MVYVAGIGYSKLLDRVNKKNNDDADDDGGGNEHLSIEYVDTTRFSTKSHRKEMKKSNYVCKFCKRRLSHPHELNTHILNNHPKKALNKQDFTG